MSSKRKAADMVTQPLKGTVLPRLRFPEFRDAGEWEISQLSELIDTITPPKKLPTKEYFRSGAYPIIDQSKNGIAGWTDDATALIRPNENLIVFGDHTCITKLLKRPFVQGADGIKIINARKQIFNEFLYHFLDLYPVTTEEYKRHFSILINKTIAYPIKKEQQKIAACLSTLDDAISAVGRKLEALKSHKKGLMQQLFPREGETIPRLRFPEFRGAGEWQVIRLGDACEKVMDGTHFGGVQ